MTSVSNSPSRLRGSLGRLRKLLQYPPTQIENLVTRPDESQGRIEKLQRNALSLLMQGEARASQGLISPAEIGTLRRFDLENRARALTNPVYLGDHTALCRVLGGYKIYLDTRDTGFGSHVLLDGYWETWLTIFIARNVRPGMNAIDIGANYGYYTLLLGALVGASGHVYAVEPNPAIIAKLRRSIDLNGLASRTTLIAAAAGATDGAEVFLFAPHGEPKNGTIVTSPEVRAASSGDIHSVPQVTIDQAAAAAPRIDFVKIDAEGAEQAIITGMQQILMRDKPGLVLEFNAGRYRNPSGFVDQLRGIYGRMRYIDFAGDPCELTPAALLEDRSGDDWLLYFDDPAT